MQKLLVTIVIATIMLSACNTTNIPSVQTAGPSAVTEIPLPVQTKITMAPQETGEVYVVCSNTLSDAAKINAAIQGSALGDEITISGQCLINQTIKLLGHRSYRGTSITGTMLKQADGANLSAMLATDTYLDNQEPLGDPVSISQMTLDGNSKMNPQAKTDGIILRCWLSVVEYMEITDMSQDGIRLAYKSENGTDLTFAPISSRISGNLIDRSGRYGVYGEFHVTDWNLLDNWIGYSGVDGIHLEDVSGWVIERNHIYGVPHNGIYADHMYGTSISDNLIEGFGETDEVGEWYGIYATVQGNAASTMIGNRIFNFYDNIPRNPASTYRYIGLIFHGSSAISVTSNVLRGMGKGNETGLYYTSMGNDKGVVTSANNIVEDVQTERTILNGVTLITGY